MRTETFGKILPMRTEWSLFTRDGIQNFFDKIWSLYKTFFVNLNRIQNFFVNLNRIQNYFQHMNRIQNYISEIWLIYKREVLYFRPIYNSTFVYQLDTKETPFSRIIWNCWKFIPIELLTLYSTYYISFGSQILVAVTSS